MSETLCRVADCDQPTSDQAMVCTGCSRKLRFNLLDVPDLVSELEITLGRQSRLGGMPNGSRSTEKPVFFDPRASEVSHAFRGTLVGWVRLVWEEKHSSTRRALPEDKLSALSGWLIPEIEWLRHHEAGGEAVTEILAAIRNVRYLIDRPADRIFVGICSTVMEGVECTEPLYAKPGKPEVRCRVCGTEHVVEDRQTVLRLAVDDVLARPAEICRAVVWIDEHVRPDQITRWVQSGRLLPKGHEDGKPLYRIGDVLDRLAQSVQETRRGA